VDRLVVVSRMLRADTSSETADRADDQRHTRPASGYARSTADTAELRGQIVALIPALRAFSRALTRDATEADDLLQETLTKALGHVHQFAPGTNLKAWLFTIVRNTFYTGYNRRRREVVSPLDEAIEMRSEPSQDWSLKMHAVDAAMRQLPPHQREALTLVGCAGLSYEEAAAVCGCALGTIRSRVSRARTRLLELLEVDALEEFLEHEPQRF